MVCETFTFLVLGNGASLGYKNRGENSVEFLCNLSLEFLRVDHQVSFWLSLHPFCIKLSK